MAYPEVIVCGNYLVFSTVLSRRYGDQHYISIHLGLRELVFYKFPERTIPHREPNSEEILKVVEVLDKHNGDNADLIDRARVILKNYIEGA